MRNEKNKFRTEDSDWEYYEYIAVHIDVCTYILHTSNQFLKEIPLTICDEYKSRQNECCDLLRHVRTRTYVSVD